jgi:hypothetical protein
MSNICSQCCGKKWDGEIKVMCCSDVAFNKTFEFLMKIPRAASASQTFVNHRVEIFLVLRRKAFVNHRVEIFLVLRRKLVYSFIRQTDVTSNSIVRCRLRLFFLAS